MFKDMACYPPGFIIYIKHISSKATTEPAQVFLQSPLSYEITQTSSYPTSVFC